MLRLRTYVGRWLFGKSRCGGPTIKLLGLDPSPAVRAGVESGPEQDAVMRRLIAMPVMMRETYLLYMVDHMSIDAIAERLAIPRREAVNNLRHAIGALRAGGSS